MLHEKSFFVGISGIIGCGKSTLAKRLAESLDAVAYYEPVKENPYLADFYKDKERWGFAMQIELLNHRFRQHQEVVWRNGRAVQDRTIFEDTIFAQMLYESGFMNKREYKTYLDLFCNMTKFLQRPDLLLHLDVTPEKALQRILIRDREEERNLISLQYLQELHNGYARFLDNMKDILNIEVVPYNEFKPVEEIKEIVLAQVNKSYRDRWGAHL
jgi:deoxyadenosine kinase